MLPLLQDLVEQEGSDFQRIDNRWRPRNLLLLPQVRILLKDIERIYDRVSRAEGEFATLDRKDVYIAMVRRMRIWVRQASFTWKSDHLIFIQSVASFYRDYGKILRLLKIDLLRGRLGQPS